MSTPFISESVGSFTSFTVNHKYHGIFHIEQAGGPVHTLPEPRKVRVEVIRSWLISLPH